MSRLHVDHKDIKNFAENKVNLKADFAKKYREQAGRLKEKLENYLKEHKEFSLKKILMSGSLAKGTSLKDINDIDLACYISGSDVPRDIDALLNYLEDKLKTAFPNFTPDQVTRQNYSICVSFRGTGLDVDIVPIIYDGDPDWYGCLVSKENGDLLETCIPRHLEFIRKRKANDPHFAQIVRLIKFWAKKQKKEDPDFRFKSFMIELILAHLSDKGQDLSDYPEALQSFFTYIARTNLEEQISFSDYYDKSKASKFSDIIQIIDPVNSKNNAAKLYSQSNVDKIVEAALDAGDAIDAALVAPTKEKTLYYWQKVFGSTFSV
ncbi:CBASS oligonucleotide cyclase [Neisseria sp. Ec49-e6-T10]|uniref:CBASS oligonucleotide cyclase n=1 Tax=Neisseria sp. Ec49-e6-T10 TaxID=3140744 RepID=UPI003EC10F1C